MRRDKGLPYFTLLDFSLLRSFLSLSCTIKHFGGRQCGKSDSRCILLIPTNYTWVDSLPTCNVSCFFLPDCCLRTRTLIFFNSFHKPGLHTTMRGYFHFYSKIDFLISKPNSSEHPRLPVCMWTFKTSQNSVGSFSLVEVVTRNE